LNQPYYPRVECYVAKRSGVRGRCLEPRFRDKAEGAAALQSFGALTHCRCPPEGLLRGPRLRIHPELLVDLGDDDVPASHRHDGEYPQRDSGDDVATLP